MENELVLWKWKDYTNHAWIEETILTSMEITATLVKQWRILVKPGIFYATYQVAGTMIFPRRVHRQV